MYCSNNFVIAFLIFSVTTDIFGGRKYITIENKLSETIEIRGALSVMHQKKSAKPLLFQTSIATGRQIKTRPIKSLKIKVGNFACKDEIEVKEVMMNEKDNVVSIGPKNQKEIIINDWFVVQLNK